MLRLFILLLIFSLASCFYVQREDINTYDDLIYSIKFYKMVMSITALDLQREDKLEVIKLDKKKDIIFSVVRGNKHIKNINFNFNTMILNIENFLIHLEVDYSYGMPFAEFQDSYERNKIMLYELECLF